MNKPLDPLPYADQIQRRKTSSLTPYVNNARTHDDDQVAKIAASITAYGFNNPVLIGTDGEIIAGHGRVLAAELLGLEEVPVVVLGHLTEAQRRAYVLADNKLAELSGWDEALLAEELAAVAGEGLELDVLGFADDEIADVLGVDFIDVASYSRAKPGTGAALSPSAGASPQDPAPPEPEPAPAPEPLPPEPEAVEVSRPGDIWVLGRHRVMCGDSTNADDVAALMAGECCELLHADPPYGMGKESEGVANDNLRREKLDAFQVAWWEAAAPHITDPASLYIWGRPADLWRLWWRHLSSDDRLTAHNHITWDKGSAPGILSSDMRNYPAATESVLFIGLGAEKYNNNSDNFWPGWQPLLDKLRARADAAGLKPKRAKEITGLGMYSHWFTPSQWAMIPAEHYQALADEYPEAFPDDYADLWAEYEQLAKGYEAVKAEFYAGRRYFDNVHDKMTDVWRFERVWNAGERFGHSTPKPLGIMGRIVRTSLPEGGLCYEPFGGTGSTLIAAENTGRRCYTMELLPRWVDVIVRRWQELTGEAATLESSGETWADIRTARTPSPF